MLAPNVLAREAALMRQTGSQDAANILSPNEIAEEIGTPTPTHAQIKAWIVGDDDDRRELVAQLVDPTLGTNADEDRALIDAWADGWATRAEATMRAIFEDRVDRAVFYEGPHGLLGLGWYVARDDAPPDGPHASKPEAYAAARRLLGGA